jgi:hypothetical protein
VAAAATQAVVARLADAHAVVIEVEHEPGGANVAVRVAPGAVVLPLEDVAQPAEARGSESPVW